MATRQEQVNAALQRLSNNLGSDMAGAVAVSLDGIVLASLLSAGVNADRVGAVAATIVGPVEVMPPLPPPDGMALPPLK